ncbi:phage tail assembly chaperone (plasmid) [Burkholderia vietnamiensis]|uniref:phage tail assembly chaperone n=1 Tax=Burkholderia vietnamiensis TaxID=60552 RepID=UPI002019F02A|nr:phage tail assembly chaperone [Burkholderia vietnamiensis]MCO1349951.1 phage tail assembly chaperone [Burkholderia vietnamiensis]MCO1432421.1 phage tail assembly chaperone [Burkholderia vietnamiensis]UQN47416.1 phage tail assembly chaperone [Burkholderia vietnamiensis]
MGQKQAAYDLNNGIVAFYDTVDSPAPSDVKVVDITDSDWRTAIEAPSLGKRAVLNERMQIVLIDPPTPTRAEIANAKRAERDVALHATDWLVSRHQDEKLLGDGTTLTADQFALLLKYRQALRECSELPGWPNVALPVPPPFATQGTAAIE